MQPNHVDGEVTTNPVSIKETFIAPLCKPTPLSKYFALALFVVLPFVGAYVGWNLKSSHVL
jgi:hypothetical protein